jgi:acetyl-CoA carboxylase biotin carboxyl carrier protein
MPDPGGAAELIELIDRLEELLVRSALSELEVQAGDTTLVLRSTAAVAPAARADDGGQRHRQADGEAGMEPAGTSSAVPERDRLVSLGPGLRSIIAPLTGLFYLSPAPGAAPYLKLGGQVNAGQVIGLIEAMKLFNEIKSDVSGTVRRIAVVDGALVKAKQVLIEVEPS